VVFLCLNVRDSNSFEKAKLEAQNTLAAKLLGGFALVILIIFNLARPSITEPSEVSAKVTFAFK